MYLDGWIRAQKYPFRFMKNILLKKNVYDFLNNYSVGKIFYQLMKITTILTKMTFPIKTKKGSGRNRVFSYSCLFFRFMRTTFPLDSCTVHSSSALLQLPQLSMCGDYITHSLTVTGHLPYRGNLALNKWLCRIMEDRMA